MKKTAVIIIFVLFAFPCFAQRASGPVKIHSNSMQYFGEQSKSTFSGNVVAVSDAYTLTADVLDVYFSKDNEVQKIVGKGNVNFKTTDMLAVANDGELDQTDKTIKMNGNVKIWQSENYLEGEIVRIKYETREIFVDKGGTERVTVIFNPEDNSTGVR